MKSLKGTQTADNLARAFAGECQARTRYSFYASVASKEGHKQIEAVFTETADNERAHAKVFMNHLLAGLKPDKDAVPIHVDTDYPLGFKTTLENLSYAADGEYHESIDYPKFADIAKEEGFPEVEMSFRKIGEIEKSHEIRYRDLLSSLTNQTLYKRDTPQYWKCRNCGFIFDGNEAPKVCPACEHPQGYFEIMYNTRG